MSIEISNVELYALKKLAIICGALAKSLKNQSSAAEQRALTGILVNVINRAEIDNAGAR
jgi:hypothetical protein